MRVQVRFFAALRERAGTDGLWLEGLSEPLTVAELKAELGRRHPELGDLSFVRGVVENTYVAEDRALVDGDELALLPPVSGGAPSTDLHWNVGRFELFDTPLDAGLAGQRVGHDDSRRRSWPA